jgi:hypothetical protein
MMSMSDNDLIVGASLALRNTAPSRQLEEWVQELEKPQNQDRNTQADWDETEEHFWRVTGLRAPERIRQLQDKRDARKLAINEMAQTAARVNSDTLIVTCFEEAKMKKNVAALSASGTIQIFGRVLTNTLETRTRMITIQPITLSVATQT